MVRKLAAASRRPGFRSPIAQRTWSGVAAAGVCRHQLPFGRIDKRRQIRDHAGRIDCEFA